MLKVETQDKQHIVFGSEDWEGERNKAYQRLGDWEKETATLPYRWVSYQRLP